MKLKLITLFLLIFSFQTVSAVVVVDGKGTIEKNETVHKKEISNKKTWYHKGTKKKLKKKRKFKFFQWFKLKKAFKKKSKSSKKYELFSVIAGIAGLIAFTAIYFVALGWFVSMGIAGGLFGYLGLEKIKEDPENLKGKAFSWIGILSGVLLAIAFLLFVILLLSNPSFGG